MSASPARRKSTLPTIFKFAAFALASLCAVAAAPAAAPTSFADALSGARALLAQGRLDEARAAVEHAQKLDPSRFEGAATAAEIFLALGKPGEAAAALGDARQLAPPERQASLDGIAARLGLKPAAGRASPGGAPGRPWTNSQGLRFVPVPGTEVLFAVWDTRVCDFEAFVKETGYKAEAGMVSYDKAIGTLIEKGDSWRHPGFTQTPLDPVCGVSWYDAKAYCDWLTAKERRAGTLQAPARYRLPTDAEWSVAVGGLKYPWGDDWPPPKGAGNYAGDGDDLPFTIAEGYSDGFPRTSPVGSFRPNRFGLHDMGGNAWQWCEDWYPSRLNSNALREHLRYLDRDFSGTAIGVLRGGSWGSAGPSHLLSDYRNLAAPGTRRDNFSFRCVIESAPAAPR